MESLLSNKKILFYGPALTDDKKKIILNDYDYIIITNNMISIFFDKYNYTKNNIIYLSNQLYSMNYIDNILKYDSYIIKYLLVTKKSYDYLKKYINEDKIYLLKSFSLNRTIPLGLSRILELIKNIKFKKLYITGVTFYNEGNINKCYEKKYMIKESIVYNIFNKDKNIHNIEYNKIFTKKICNKNNNIELSPILKKILFDN